MCPIYSGCPLGCVAVVAGLDDLWVNDNTGRLSGDVGLKTCAGMWGRRGCARVAVDVAQDVQRSLLHRTIFG